MLSFERHDEDEADSLLASSPSPQHHAFEEEEGLLAAEETEGSRRTLILQAGLGDATEADEPLNVRRRRRRREKERQQLFWWKCATGVLGLMLLVSWLGFASHVSTHRAADFGVQVRGSSVSMSP